MTDLREKRIYRITLAGSVVNLVLIVLKFLAGIFGKSSAMLADAVHSLTDFATDVIVVIFVKISGKPRDSDHEYGHGKYETFATFIIGALLAAAGIGLMIEGGEHVWRSLHGESLERPTMLALIIAVVSIVSKEILYRVTLRIGNEVKSQAVCANAWHHRSDAISSAGTLIGVAGAMFLGERWRILDPIAAILVSLFIIKSGWDIMRPCINELLEGSLSKEEEEEIHRIVLGVNGAEQIHNLRTRRIGNNVAMDFHVKMNGDISLREAHSIATAIEIELHKKFVHSSFVNIHMEPNERKNECEEKH
ncbi:MAG: cation diffusion facilitator family transporter [Muribaculaceae bacterium]|nr:cation diffusion facilitator family transporter [Muribaculaceae bacterium]